MMCLCPNVQLKKARAQHKREEERAKRRQHEELERIREAEAQRKHEAALAAIDGAPAGKLISALRSSDAAPSRCAHLPGTRPAPKACPSPALLTRTMTKVRSSVIMSPRRPPLDVPAGKLIRTLKPSEAAGNR